VQGEWFVPSPFANDGQLRLAVQWVGVGGNCGSLCGGQLVQAGSGVETYSGGTAYFTWFEVYPDQPLWTDLPIGTTAGNLMFVSISAGTSQSYIFIENETTGSYEEVNPAATAAGCTCPGAEAIEEDPGNGSGGQYLMTFTNPTYFYNDAAVTNSGDAWINSLPWYGVAATDSRGNTLAYPTGLAGNGSFEVVRTGND
jgi:hypothetical protein